MANVDIRAEYEILVRKQVELEAELEQDEKKIEELEAENEALVRRAESAEQDWQTAEFENKQLRERLQTVKDNISFYGKCAKRTQEIEQTLNKGGGPTSNGVRTADSGQG